jgi:class 3 adenylate cyclase/tetratricopeptide (TPR) repeat protein
MKPTTLHRFVPRSTRKRAQIGPIGQPEMDASASGALFVADIAGFTALTELKARAGQAGIEEMQVILTSCFERIVSIIEESGGEVFKFAGDATLAWWPATGADLQEMTLASAAAALRIQALVPELATSLGVPLSLRIGIGAGRLFTATVGGEAGRWEVLLGGEALQQVAAIPTVTSGQVTLSQQAWALLRQDCSGELVTEGDNKGFVIHSLTPPPPRPTHPSPAALEPSTTQLAPFVPRHLLQRLLANPHDLLAELRSASVLFAIVPVPTDLADLQQCVQAMQRSVYSTGGSVVQCLVDDKVHLVLVAAWGIPGSSYPDDAERAMRAAHTLLASRTAQGHTLSVGVASGRIFAGVRGGSSSRAEFALIGAIVNLAARLAQAAAQAAQGRVCCDEATARTVQAIGFKALPPTQLKGIGWVTIYASLGQRRVDLSNAGALIGRETERTLLMNALERVVNNPNTSVALLVEGEAGIGKSHLCSAFAKAVREQGLMLASGASDPLDDSAAYQPLRRVFDTLLGLDDGLSSAGRQERVLMLLGEDTAVRERASLLAAVLDLDLPPSPIEQHMSGRGRIEATTDLLVRLLQATHAGVARVLLLEDLHWLDSASWDVLEHAVRRCPGLVMLLSSRPLADDTPYSALFDTSEAMRLRLRPLGESAVRDIIASELDVNDVPEAVLRAVADKTQGLPLFIRQVVATLVDRGIVRNSAGSLIFDDHALAQFTIPDTIQGVVISRIDHLSPHQQNTLKAASVIGRNFSLDALGSVDVGHTRADLSMLVESGLIEQSGDQDHFQFSHALVRDAVYGLLPFSYRRRLHAALGAWYEHHAGDNPLMLSRIANHWTHAHDPVRALHALEQAGNHALRTGANREAQALFNRLIHLTAHGFGEGAHQPVPASFEALARWHLNLGLANYHMGELEHGRSVLETTARLLGHALPRPPMINLSLALEVARAGARQLISGWRRRSPLHTDDLDQDTHARRTAEVLSTLGRIYHLTQRPSYTMYSMLRRFNLLDRRPPSPEQMVAFSGMMYLTTMIGQHRWADAYAARVMEVNRRLHNPLAYADATMSISLAYLGQARWEPCERLAGESEQIFHRLGERQPRMVMVSVLANAAELRGDFERSMRLYRLVQELADAVGDQLGQCWAAGGLAMLAIRQGRYDEGIAQARLAVTLARASGEAASYLSDIGLLALSLFEAGDLAAARRLVDEGLDLIAKLSSFATAHHILNGLDTFSELVLRFWERESPQPGSPAWQQWAKHAALVSSRLRGYARTFAIGKPMSAQRQAMQHWLHGHHTKALVWWQRAIAAGEQTQIPYETGKAHFELARHLPPTSPEQRHHAEQAVLIFERIGALGALERARTLL